MLVFAHWRAGMAAGHKNALRAHPTFRITHYVAPAGAVHTCI
jgi:hypothetical protein